QEGQQRELARRLAAQRLAPLQPHLGDVKHLIVLPSDIMAGIPIEILTDRYSISYAPSGTLFAYLQEQRAQARPPAGNPLALGAPVFLPAPTAPSRPTPPAQGLLIAATMPGSNAHKAGIRAGDVLLRYAGTPLARADDLKTALAQNTRAA